MTVVAGLEVTGENTLEAVVVAGANDDDEDILFPLKGLFIVPSRLLRLPICPTPPNNCINCCCDILFNKFCKSPSAFVPPPLCEPGVGGLLSTSFIFLQCSSSFSVFRSYNFQNRYELFFNSNFFKEVSHIVSFTCNQKKNFLLDDLNRKR